jgi:hypothetical protein
LSNGKLAFFKSWFYLGWKFEHVKYIYRHPSGVICTVSNEEIGQHFLKPCEWNHDWPLWYRGTPSLSHEYFYMHACYQRSTGLFAVCCQRRGALVLANSRDKLLLGHVPHLASKLFASFLHVRYCWCLQYLPCRSLHY